MTCRCSALAVQRTVPCIPVTAAWSCDIREIGGDTGFWHNVFNCFHTNEWNPLKSSLWFLIGYITIQDNFNFFFFHASRCLLFLCSAAGNTSIVFSFSFKTMAQCSVCSSWFEFVNVNKALAHSSGCLSPSCTMWPLKPKLLDFF